MDGVDEGFLGVDSSEINSALGACACVKIVPDYTLDTLLAFCRQGVSTSLEICPAGLRCIFDSLCLERVQLLRYLIFVSNAIVVKID